MKQIWKNCGDHGATRRHFLFGAEPAGLLRVHADAQVSTIGPVRPRNSARACIFINLNGGASHLDTFDPKDGPWNLSDAAIAQYPGGLALSRKYFPKLSTLTEDLLVLRSCTVWEAAHERAQFYIQTAHSQNPALATEIPHIGAVVAYEKGFKGLLPPFFFFNQSALQGATFLGGPNMPMMPPATRTGVATLTHNFFGSSSQQRFEERLKLLQHRAEPLRQKPYNEVMAAYASYYPRAKSMMYEDSVDTVFKFSTDDENRYGANGTGRPLLWARHTVRAMQGAVLIDVTQGGWALHVGQFDTGLSPNLFTLSNCLDRAVGSLAVVLKASGDLNETLIVMMREFD